MLPFSSLLKNVQTLTFIAVSKYYSWETTKKYAFMGLLMHLVVPRGSSRRSTRSLGNKIVQSRDPLSLCDYRNVGLFLTHL